MVFANLSNVDTIEHYDLWNGQMDVVLCNPPFGSRTLETRASVLKHYDLGHQWIVENNRWVMTEKLMHAQQLGMHSKKFKKHLMRYGKQMINGQFSIRLSSVWTVQLSLSMMRKNKADS